MYASLTRSITPRRRSRRGRARLAGHGQELPVASISPATASDWLLPVNFVW
jgi:hypothetical protein